MQWCRPPTSSSYPIELPREESVILGCAVFIAYGAVRHAAGLRAGEQAAVMATGGVGSDVVQITRAFGAPQIIAVDIVPEKLDVARQLWVPPTWYTTRRRRRGGSGQRAHRR
jgi:succinate semialdehyde reductase (NADPH)